MGRSNKAFRNGYRDQKGVEYATHDMGDHILATATGPDDENGNPVESSAEFTFDSGTGAHEVSPNTLSLHPKHQALGNVGRAMRTIVNANY